MSSYLIDSDFMCPMGTLSMTKIAFEFNFICKLSRFYSTNVSKK